jgi:hypothetical protein
MANAPLTNSRELDKNTVSVENKERDECHYWRPELVLLQTLGFAGAVHYRRLRFVMDANSEHVNPEDYCCMLYFFR